MRENTAISCGGSDDVTGFEMTTGEKMVVTAAVTAAAINPVAVAGVATGVAIGYGLSQIYNAGYAAGSARHNR